MTSRSARLTYSVSSWILDYPSPTLRDQVPLLRVALEGINNDRCVTSLATKLDQIEAGDLNQLQQQYVEVFDLNRRHALHLSYWTDGDTRRRGEVLLAFKARYRASGFLVNTSGELPDYLPLVLEFAAVAEPGDGQALLQEYRPSLELLRFALLESEPSYAAVVAAICSTLPGPSPVDRMAAHAMANAGPPVEHVGLDPYDVRLLPLSSGGPS
jgi:nitrate reductase delta subunit